MKPDAVIVAGYYQEGGLILKKMREMGMDQPVLGDNGFVSPELVKIAGKAADNVYVSSMWSPDRDSETTREFVKISVQSTIMIRIILRRALMYR